MTRSRVNKPRRLHRAEADGIVPPRSHNLNGHTALINALAPVKLMGFGTFGGHERLIERFIFFLVHRAVYIVVGFSPVVSRLHERLFKINALRRNNRCGGVKEAEVSAAKLLDFFGKRRGCERPCGNYYNAVRNLGYFFSDERYFFSRKYFFGNKSGKSVSVNRKRSACGNGCRLGAFNAERAEHLHFGFQHSRRTAEPHCLERV